MLDQILSFNIIDQINDHLMPGWKDYGKWSYQTLFEATKTDLISDGKIISFYIFAGPDHQIIVTRNHKVSSLK